MNEEQVFSLVSVGEAVRHTGATDANKRSSRSHTIFRMVLESRPRAGATITSNNKGSQVRTSTLFLTDLAGSESVKLTNAKGQRRKEGAYINKSLLTLGKIITALSEKRKDSLIHLPYRDSKLTRILQTSLGGNARVAVVCTITPAVSCFDETVNTLKFAERK